MRLLRSVPSSRRGRRGALFTIPVLALGIGALAPVTAAQATATPVGYQVGMKAPDLTMTNVAGKQLSLTSLHGKYVVLDLSTMWCSPSELAAKSARAAADSLNAPGALNHQLVWITAEMEGNTVGVAPTTEEMLSFASRNTLGDAQTPVENFGAVGSPAYKAAAAQLAGYAQANDPNFQDEPFGSFPTFVVLDPNGVILDVEFGFGGGTPQNPQTIQNIKAALGAVTVPYTPTPKRTDLPVLSSVQLTGSVDGASGSATVDGAGFGFGLLGSTPLAYFFNPTGQQVNPQFFYAPNGVDSAAPFPQASTYTFQLTPSWSTTGPYKNLSTVSSGSVTLAGWPTGDTSFDPNTMIHLVTTVPVDATGHVGPFTIADALTHLPPTEQVPSGGIDVWEIDVDAHFSGPIKDNYGNGNY